MLHEAKLTGGVGTAIGICLLACILASPASQASAEVVLVEPEDGATVGPRFMFRFSLEGLDDPKAVREHAFRIILSSDGFDTEAYVFDQVRDKNGWAYRVPPDYDKFPELEDVYENDDLPGGLYMLRKPIEDATYEWRVDLWDGIQWTEGGDTYRFTVDTVAPAMVDTLEMEYDSARGMITLSWEPVFVDSDGYSDEVVRYHVYRYEYPGTTTMVIRAKEIAVIEETYYVDDISQAGSRALLFYKVRAEDAAGNITDKKIRPHGGQKIERGKDGRPVRPKKPWRR